MTYPLIHTDSGIKFFTWDQLRLWLVQIHHIARPENAADLPEILAGFGITEHIESTEELSTPEQIIEDLTNAVQNYLDETAQKRGYDSIISACSYVNSTVPRFASDGAKAIILRDSTWVKCQEVLADVTDGVREQPTAEQLIALLPTVSW